MLEVRTQSRAGCVSNVDLNASYIIPFDRNRLNQTNISSVFIFNRL
jgi:hypothetical protein